MANNTIGTVYVQVEPTTSGIQGKLSKSLSGEAQEAGEKAGSKLGSALGGALKVGGVAVAAATSAIGAFGKASLDAGMSFDSSMSQVAATMGMSVAEINTAGSETQKTFETLRNFAQEMGSTTAFSATEAANALNYMALAGYDADTSMKMLPTVLDLAAAGGIDLASASDMVTDAQSALGLSLDETAQMVNQMAVTASKSNTSVAQLGEGFLTIGANAKTLSGGTVELSAALGILADNGIKSAEGGTHLRNIMLSLTPTTDKAAKAWEALGVSAYDADGNLRPLQDTFGELSAAMEGMSDKEKTATISAMFNKTDLASVNALLATSSERWDELSGAISSAEGSANEMAGVQLNNLSGDITLFQSALEGAKIAVSDSLTPALREFVQFGADGLSQLTAAFKEGGIDGAMSKLGDLLGEAANKLIEKLPDMVDAGIKLLQSLLDAILQNIDILVQAALQVVMSIVDFILTNLQPLIEAALQIVLSLAQGIAENLPTLIPAIIETVLSIVEYLLDNIDLVIDAAIQLMIGLTEGLVKAIPILIEKVPEIIIKLVSAIIKALPKLWEAGKEMLAKLVVGLWDNRGNLFDKGVELLTRLKDKIVEIAKKFFDIGKNIVEGIKNGISEAWSGLTSWFSDKAEGLINPLKNKLQIHSPSRVFADKIGKWIPAGIASGIENNKNVIDEAMSDVNDTLTGSAIRTDAIVNSSIDTRYLQVDNSDQNVEVIRFLSDFLPSIMKETNVNVSLEGDAGGIFRAVRRQNDIYKGMTGRTAFA